MKADESCIFCQIIKGEMPAKRVYEDDDFVVFEDIHPKAPVHVLMVPKKHVPGVNGVGKEDEEWVGRLFEVAARVADKLEISDGYRLQVNSGKKAGQVVFHLHTHLMGGWKDDQVV